MLCSHCSGRELRSCNERRQSRMPLRRSARTRTEGLHRVQMTRLFLLDLSLPGLMTGLLSSYLRLHKVWLSVANHLLNVGLRRLAAAKEAAAALSALR